MTSGFGFFLKNQSVFFFSIFLMNNCVCAWCLSNYRAECGCVCMCVRVGGWTAQGLKDLALVLQTRGTQLAARRHLNRLVDKGRESSERLVVSFDTNHREEEEEGGCAVRSATSCHRGRGKQALILVVQHLLLLQHLLFFFPLL